MQNSDIREAARIYKVKLWEVAEKLNLSDSNFSRKLRYELSTNEKKKIIEIIISISDLRKEM